MPENCSATRTDGKPCRAQAVEGIEFCKHHAPRLGLDTWDPTIEVANEAAVTAAFCRWLATEGWSVQTEVAGADVVATKDDITLVAEAKGVTTSPGLDIDTMYGQLLRRINPTNSGTRYAVVVPSEAARFATRVPPAVLAALGITIYTVDRKGQVQELGDTR